MQDLRWAKPVPLCGGFFTLITSVKCSELGKIFKVKSYGYFKKFISACYFNGFLAILGFEK
jgi:hypothetical protein